jgi:hypothetical protein
MRMIALFAAVALLAGCAAPSGSVWRFDNLDHIGGAAAHPEGGAKLVTTGAGPAVQFDGIKAALFVDKHPLAGAATFTAEAIFRPEGGSFEQRWLHLAEIDPNGKETGARFLFEIRVVGNSWYLDAFTRGPGYNHALIVPDKLHPLGPWYRVAMTYDGKTFRSYVDGELQSEAAISFQPQGSGRSSFGVRFNRVDYFKGSVYEARFTPRALAPAEFLAMPPGLN